MCDGVVYLWMCAFDLRKCMCMRVFACLLSVCYAMDMSAYCVCTRVYVCVSLCIGVCMRVHVTACLSAHMSACMFVSMPH